MAALEDKYEQDSSVSCVHFDLTMACRSELVSAFEPLNVGRICGPLCSLLDIRYATLSRNCSTGLIGVKS